jgi:membrane protease YdiL (CAAX protease family)
MGNGAAGDAQDSRRCCSGIASGVVVGAMVYPSLLTAIYFVLLGGQASGVQQIVFGAGKIFQFAFPAVWMFLWLRERPTLTKPNLAGLLWGGGFGAITLSAMVALYHLAFKPWGVFARAAEIVPAKIAGFGITTVGQYLLLAVFYCLCHSLLEEYYWRWFVYRRLRERAAALPAAAISGMAFAAHHVILLATFFGWSSPWAYLFSLCVAVGGFVWALIYEQSKSLYGPWLSHLLIDAGIFIVGYDLL